MKSETSEIKQRRIIDNNKMAVVSAISDYSVQSHIYVPIWNHAGLGEYGVVTHVF